MSSEKITVMLADDSSVIRRALSIMLESDPCIEVVSSVSNGENAVTMARSRNPDVVILDVEMPVMDGLTALPKILENAPGTKVIMCSSLTAQGADTTIKAMALGAVECLVKPTGAEARGEDSAFKKTLINLVKSLGATRSGGSPPCTQVSASDPAVVTRTPKRPLPAKSTEKPDISLKNDANVYKGKPKILAIGSSTGGPKALFQVIDDIGKLDIPIVITQHMPATFTKILAEHITRQTGIEALEGEEGMIIEPGKIYIAPGGLHMLFEEKNNQLIIRLNDGPDENFCKPAVDPMLRSLVDIYDQKILCLILTGMGQDGLKGAELLADKGGRIIAQDQETSVVWGMPGAVAMAGICSEILPIGKIGDSVRKTCYV